VRRAHDRAWEGDRILEIGCGWGPASVFCAKKLNARVTGVDMDKEVFPFMDRTDPFEKFVIVEKNVIVNGDDIRDAQAVPIGGRTSENEITFSLKKPGAEKFGEWTGKNINNYLAVIIDHKVQSIAYIKSQIFDSGVINGKFTKAEAEDVAMSLRSGYLPATMKVLDEKQIGN